MKEPNFWKRHPLLDTISLFAFIVLSYWIAGCVYSRAIAAISRYIIDHF